MAKVRITIELDVSGPDADEASDAIDDALDAGTIQDAIEDSRESMELDFTIESATVSDPEALGRRRTGRRG
jgi:hypothetical protein